MKYFGTDGIRGIVNEDLTHEFLYKLGCSISILNYKKIYIGYDSRESNNFMLISIASGLLRSGVNVIDVGLISTPALQYFSKENNVLALMITASHNPYYYNGIKLFIKGEKLTLEQEELIESNLEKEIPFSLGIYLKESVNDSYLKYLNKFKINNQKKIMVDLANGATVNLAFDLFKDDENIILINDTPNGKNINDNAGSLYIEKIDLKDNDYLISFDGDGDRILIKNKDIILDGDILVYLMAKYYKYKKVVLTENVNLGLLKLFEKEKIKVYLSKIGDKNVLDLMKKEKVMIGGETSGHIINLNYMNSGDGLLNALLMIQILNDNKFMSKLNNINYYPYLNLNLAKDYSLNKLEDFKNKYLKKARLNYRVSGTEKVVRVNICAKKEEIIMKIKKEILNDEENSN